MRQRVFRRAILYWFKRYYAYRGSNQQIYEGELKGTICTLRIGEEVNMYARNAGNDQMKGICMDPFRSGEGVLQIERSQISKQKQSCKCIVRGTEAKGSPKCASLRCMARRGCFKGGLTDPWASGVCRSDLVLDNILTLISHHRSPCSAARPRYPPRFVQCL